MYHIIFNPVSGRKKNKVDSLGIVTNYLDSLKIEYKLYKTKHKNEPNEIAKQISKEYDSGELIIMGGDGTFNEVINGIDDLSKWNIDLVPIGSGNDFATLCNIEFDPIKNIDKMLANKISQVDYIKVNDFRCVNVLGTGVDVQTLLNFEKHTKLKGKFRYLVSLVEALLHVKWHKFEVSLDDGEFVAKEGFMVALCNGSTYGGGIPICPGAKYDDGKLEFVYVDKMKKAKIPFKLIKLLNKKVLTFKETEHIYCEKAIIRYKENLTIQVDGNIVNEYNEYKCEIVKHGINLYI